MADHVQVKATTLIEGIEIEQADKAGVEDRNRAAALSTDTQLGARYFLDIKLFGALLSIALSAIAAFWGFSPPAAILTFIAEDIGDAGGNSSLFSIVWSMCSSIGILLNGRLSDKFGRRYFVIGAAFMSLLGAIVACTAQSMKVLIGANVLLGLASGVQSSYALLVGEICPNKYKWLGIMTVITLSPIPTGFGAYLARMLVENANWRWVYYIQIMMLVATLALQIVFYKPPNFRQLHGGRSRMAEVRRVDWVGIFLLVSGLSMFLLGVSWGGQPNPWTSPKIISLVVVGGFLLIGLVFWDLYSGTANPMVPVRVWKDLRGFTPLACIAGCAGAMYIAPVIVWPSQVIRVYGSHFTDWQSEAWATTTIAFGLTAGMLFTGFSFHIIKRVRYQLIVQCIVSTTFLTALASCDRHSLTNALVFSTIGSFPVGAMEVTPQVLVQMDSTNADIGAVYAFLHCFRTAVGSIMTAVFLAILNSKVPQKIASIVPPAAIAAGLPVSSLPALSSAITNGTANALASVPGMKASIETAVQDALSDAYAASYAYVYYSVLALGGVAIFAAFALRDYDDKLSGHVAKQMYHGKRAMADVETKLSEKELQTA